MDLKTLNKEIYPASIEATDFSIADRIQYILGSLAKNPDHSPTQNEFLRIAHSDEIKHPKFQEYLQNTRKYNDIVLHLEHLVTQISNLKIQQGAIKFLEAISSDFKSTNIPETIFSEPLFSKKISVQIGVILALGLALGLSSKYLGDKHLPEKPVMVSQPINQ